MSAPQLSPKRTGAWWLKFAIACSACAFAGWLLLALIAMPFVGYTLFDYPGVVGLLVLLVLVPVMWRRLR
jgi:hypothetical protein